MRLLAAIYKMAFCIYPQNDGADLKAERSGGIGGPISRWAPPCRWTRLQS